MLFHSPQFILFFLPTVLVLYFVCERTGNRRLVLAMLLVASLFFYGWWKPVYLWVIIGSVVANYLLASFLGRRASPSPWRRRVLIAGILANLAALGYFKYAGFLFANLNQVVKTGWSLTSVALPLAISFFTFQQIAFLIDTYRSRTQPYTPIEYGLFVTFFPQLIAGPIVRHNELLPQFDRFGKPVASRRTLSRNLAIGATLFIIGLFKKVVLADGFAVDAIPVFQAADAGEALAFLAAWKGALSYTLQLYFDFSGYCDMAIGLARLFGIVLPMNFDAPYKAANLIEFWKRWHATLSRFLRDYLYIPLGGSRTGWFNHHRNIMITMVLCGIWHGAGWNFIVWGALQGLYLNINVAWRTFRRTVLGHDLTHTSAVGMFSARLLTFTSFVLGLVVFRPATLSGSLRMYRAMVGHDVPPGGPQTLSTLTHTRVAAILPEIQVLLPKARILVSDQVLPFVMIAFGLMICWMLPSSTSIAASMDSERLDRRGVYLLAFGMGILAFITALYYVDPRPSPFIYYQF